MKNAARYACQECGNVTLKWQGQCHTCGEWNTIVEESATEVAISLGDPTTLDRPESIAAIDDSQVARLASGIGELDRVLGGGFVPRIECPSRRRARHWQVHLVTPSRSGVCSLESIF